MAAGGRFDKAGPTPAWNFATWTGSAWAAAGTGQGMMGGDGDGTEINALAVQTTGPTPTVFAGGAFRYAGAVAADYVARWDGSAWSALGDGVWNTVNALALQGAAPPLYAGGRLHTAGLRSSYGFARWYYQTYLP